jgi:ribosome-associated protein
MTVRELDRERPLAAHELVGDIARYAAEKKAADIIELDLRALVSYADYLVICTGNTERQTKAIHDSIAEGLAGEHRLHPRRVEGLPSARWILMDYLDVVVHIFTPATRDFYRLEALWGEAPARHLGESGDEAIHERAGERLAEPAARRFA